MLPLMPTEWCEVDALARDTINEGWNGKKLPSGVRTSLKLAADTVSLPEMTEQQRADVLRTHRWRAGALAVFLLACAIRGIGEISIAVDDGETFASIAAPVTFLVATVIVVVRAWRADPIRLQRIYQRRQLVKAGKVAVAARARELMAQDARAATAAAASAQVVHEEPQDSAYLMTPREAEFLAARIMTRLGARQVRVTAAVADGGLDVEADGYVAEVKHHTAPVPESYVQRIVGVAQARGAIAMVFTLTGYRPNAVSFADRTGAMLFVYDPATETATPWSQAARIAMQRGL